MSSAGSLEGRVAFDARPAPLPPLRADPRAAVCGARPAPNPALRVGPDLGLAGVVVALQDLGAPSPARAELDQRGCRFVPHVQVVPAGSELVVRNSDPVLHNVRAVTVTGSYQRFNLGLPPAGGTRRVEVTRPGALRLRCDAGHPWMQGFLFVATGPAALTGEDGAFRIEGVPPGRHRVTVWHELLGRRVFEVEVPEAGAARLEVRADPDGEPGLTARRRDS